MWRWGLPCCTSGNTLDYSDNHIVYGGTLRSAVVSGNTFSRAAFGRCAGVAPDVDALASTFGSRKTRFADGLIRVRHRHIMGGTRYNYLLVNFGPNGAGPNMENGLRSSNTVTDSDAYEYCWMASCLSPKQHIHDTGPIFSKSFPYWAQPELGDAPVQHVQIVDNFEYTGAIEPGVKTGMLALWEYTNTPYEGKPRIRTY